MYDQKALVLKVSKKISIKDFNSERFLVLKIIKVKDFD